MRAVRDEGLAHSLGVAPGPANGFTLDVIDCLERFGELIDWAMVILNPLEPWPGELCLRAAAEHDVEVITRVADYGGIFWDDVRPGHDFAANDHRLYRPKGWVDAGVEKLELLRPIAERHGLTTMQLAAQWCLAHEPVACVVPTLIQEPGGRPIEDKRAELVGTPSAVVLDDDEVARIRAIGDNTGSMSLKGAGPEHEGEARPDRWEMTEQLGEVARRWGIEPDRDLRRLSPARG
jgi:aryl-alcohol dehydrogenase-like predicted oxidoreductase